jgi:hypothetical protein
MKIADLVVTIHVDMRASNRAIDQARRVLCRLRYPPKVPARGTVSRRREKLRKAGIRR